MKGLSAVADERCRTDKLDGVITHRSSRETTMVGRGAALDGRLFPGGTDGSNTVPSSEESCERWSPLRRSSATRSPRRTYFGSMVQRGLITCAYCRCERALSKWGVTSGPPDVSQYGWSPPITVTGWAIAGAPLLLALGFAASWVISGFKSE